MTTYKNSKVAIALALATSAILTGCGSNSGGSVPVVPGAVTPGSVLGGGCVSPASPIVFSANAMAIDNNGDFIAGTIPSTTSDAYIGYQNFAGSSYGSVSIGSGSTLPYQGSYTAVDTNMPSQSAPVGEISGSMEISIGGVGTNYGTYANTGTQASGIIAISPVLQQQIAYASQYLGQTSNFGYGTGYNSWFQNGMGYTGSVCISGISMLGHLYGAAGGGGFYAQVYLYLNNTSHGYELYWE
ncbi:MAG: hypothetical protein P4M08_13625 [Oligoflexia bacterium]|nr:hypothetical protein [Oligoflexia bacterium]